MRGEDLRLVNLFAAAICLFTTLGQVEDEKDNLQLLQNAYQVLRSAGYLILEIPQRGWYLRSLKPSERFGQDENYTQVTRSYDADQNLVTEQFALVSPEEQRNYFLQYRLFNRPEITRLLAEAGFVEITFYSGYEETPLDDHCATMVISAHKPSA